MNNYIDEIIEITEQVNTVNTLNMKVSGPDARMRVINAIHEFLRRIDHEPVNINEIKVQVHLHYERKTS